MSPWVNGYVVRIGSNNWATIRTLKLRDILAGGDIVETSAFSIYESWRFVKLHVLARPRA